MAQLYIDGTRHPRPASRRTAFCDGSHDHHWREGVDIELSHWVPNVTASAFKADTSTGVAWRFIDAGAPGGYDLVSNDHVDTDGALAALVLLHPQRCAPHRATLLQAAAMGDFSAWADAPARRLFQGLALERARLQAAGTDPLDLALALHRLAFDLLEDPSLPVDSAGLQALQRAADHVDQGRIGRTLLVPRLVHYTVPADLAPATLDDVVNQPRLDRPLHPQAVLPMQVRNRLDAERLQLVSTDRGNGRFTHDLCWPAYAWADTVTLWRPPGMTSTGGENEYRFELPALRSGCAELQAQESAVGRWEMASTLSVFGALSGRHFPVVMSFMHEGRPAASALTPQAMAAVLKTALA
ncbi:MAG: DUF6687 family protein [Alphaproteobacteria bacterium]